MYPKKTKFCLFIKQVQWSGIISCLTLTDKEIGGSIEPAAWRAINTSKPSKKKSVDVCTKIRIPRVSRHSYLDEAKLDKYFNVYFFSLQFI